MLARIGIDDAAIGMGNAMTRLLTAAATALLAAWLCACGGASTKTGTTTATSATTSAVTTAATIAASKKAAAAVPPAPLDSSVDADKDNDIGAPYDDTSNGNQFAFGHAAAPSERRAIAALVKRYYANALAGNGARGCTMIYSTLAEAAPEDDGREADAPAFSRGATSCAEVLSDLYRHYRPQLAAEVPKLVVTAVRLEEHHGWAYLRFGKLPERRISVQREGHLWKLSQIYDEELQ
jgi:hypothetical protein